MEPEPAAEAPAPPPSPPAGAPAAPRGAPPAGAAPPPPDAAPPGGKAPRRIHVVEARRAFADPRATPLAAFDLALGALAAEEPRLAPGWPAFAAAARRLAALLQGPLAFFLEPAEGGGGASAALDSVLVRELLADPAVRPLVPPPRERPRAEEGGRAVYTRAAAPVRAVGRDGADRAVGAEEGFVVEGFAVAPPAWGALVRRALAPGARPGGGPAAAAAGPGFEPPPRREGGGPLARAGFALHLPAPGGGLRAVAEVLVLRSRAAAAFALGGPAAAAAAARERAAALAPFPRRGLGALVEPRAPPPGAPPPALRALLGRLERFAPAGAGGAGLWAGGRGAAAAALYAAGALGAYLEALAGGADAPAVEAFLALAAAEAAGREEAAAAAAAAARGMAEARLGLVVAEDVLGAERFARLQAALLPPRRGAGAPGGWMARAGDRVAVAGLAEALAPLAPAERGLVLSELRRRQAAWAAAAAGACPHRALARRLGRAATAEEALAALEALEAYLAPEGAAGRGAPGKAPPAWLRCRRCGDEALCPHARERVRLEAARATYEEVRARLARYAVRVPAGEEGDAYAFFCRVCSGRLGEAIEEDRAAERLGRYGALGAPLSAKIWGAALRAARRVRFAVPTDERHFAGEAAEALLPLVAAADAALPRRRAPAAAAGRPRPPPPGAPQEEEEEQLDPRTAVLVGLHVYAFVLDRIVASGGEIGFEGAPPRARPSALAELMLAALGAELGAQLSQVEDLSPEALRAGFIEAFRAVQGAGAPAARADPAAELAQQLVAFDPVYAYAAAMARAWGRLAPPGTPGPEAARRAFEAAVGAPLPALVQRSRDVARDPELAPLLLRRAGTPVPPGRPLDFHLKSARVALYAAIFTPPPTPAGPLAALRAYAPAGGAAPKPGKGVPKPGKASKVGKAPGPGKAAPERGPQGGPRSGVGGPRPLEGPGRWVRRGPLAAAQEGAVLEGYRLFVRNLKAETEAAEADFLADLRGVRACEAGLEADRLCRRLPPYAVWTWTASQQFAPEAVPLAARYDEEGRPHVWAGKGAAFYFEGPGGDVAVPGGVAAVKRAREEGVVPPGARLADVGCAVCGVRASQTGALDEARVAAAVEVVAERRSFFLFYEARCPAADLHDWGPGGACRRCGWKAGDRREGPEAEAFYARHAARFAEDRRALLRADADAGAGAGAAGTAEAAEAAEAAEDARREELAAAFRPDFTPVVRAAELAGVPAAALEALGATPGRKYAEVLEGTGAPPPPESYFDGRIYAVDAAVRLLLTEYEALRRGGALAPPELVARVPAGEAGRLAAFLPGVGGGYSASFAAIRLRRPPATVHAFALQSLCALALEVAEGSPGAPAWARELAAETARYLLARALRTSRLFARPGAFSWSLFDAGRDGDAPADLDGDAAADVGEDAAAEDAAAAANAEDEGGEFVPFSGEHADYDVGEDNPNNE